LATSSVQLRYGHCLDRIYNVSCLKNLTGIIYVTLSGNHVLNPTVK